MPIIYLSPSTQEYNEYVNGLGNEEEWMNRLADAMEPMLFASGIQYTRNTPDMTAASSIRASNAGNYNLHLALHTNASGEDQAGQNRGIIAFYFPGSARGMRAAQFLADGLKAIYPLPNLVRTEPTTTIGEVRRVRAPAVLLELGFHDNPDDANGSSPTSTPWRRASCSPSQNISAFPSSLTAIPCPGKSGRSWAPWMFTAGLTLTRRPSPNSTTAPR